MKRSIIIEIICFLFIVLFVYAAVTKLWDYEKFKIQIGQSPILMAFATWLAWVVPTVELMISIMLAISRLRLIGLYAAFTLMTMFTAYIIIIMNFAPYVPCSCGGILEDMGWTEHLIFNIAFLFLSMAGVLILLNRKAPVRQTSIA